MKVSIITAVYNRENTIIDAIHSIQAQTYTNIEHILVDGASTDCTVEVIKKYLTPSMTCISEPDGGIYDAINKGIKRSTGQVIGLLHSDDIYASESVIAQVVAEFSDPNIDAVYADATFFRDSRPNKVIRHYRSDRFRLETLPWGWMPAHTTIFFRREVFECHGFYKIDYKIASDMEFIARVFSAPNFQAKYIPTVWVRMRSGGASTSGLKSTIILNLEVLRALRENGVKTNMVKILSKYPLKLLEFFVRNR